MAEWISVKDRLPKENEFVLCYIGDRRYCCYDIAEYYHNGTWENLDHKRAFPLYWMPLPERPTFEPKKTKERVSEDVSAVEKCGNSSFRNYFSFIKG